jgi:hypothetical protein
VTSAGNVHPVWHITVGNLSADIDEKIAPIIETCWRSGFRTLTSCQDAGESNANWVELLPHMSAYVESHKGWAFIDFPIDSGLAFLSAVANAGPRDAFYVRMTHWAAPDAWERRSAAMDAAMHDESQPSNFQLSMLQVCLPGYDIPELHRRLLNHLAGRTVPPAPADWTTVSRSLRRP